MSSSFNSRALRSSKTYSQSLYPNIYVNVENSTSVSEMYDAEEISANNDRISTELIKEKSRDNFELVNEYVSTLTLLHDKLIQNGSAKTIPGADSRSDRLQTGLQ